MIIISAIGSNNVIGWGNRMPWNVPEEYRQFLDLIRDQVVIMGRISYEIFKNNLTSKVNLVVTRQPQKYPGVITCSNVVEAVRKGRAYGKTLFSAGGASVYEQTIPLAEKMFLSYIKGDFRGDKFFPQFEEKEWEVEKREDHPQFEFVVYRRI